MRRTTDRQSYNLGCKRRPDWENHYSPRRRNERDVRGTKYEIEEIAEPVVDAILKVHRTLRPGRSSRRSMSCQWFHWLTSSSSRRCGESLSSR